VTTRSGCRLLDSDNEAADDDDVARSVADSCQSLADDLRPLHDTEDISSTTTNDTAFSDDPAPREPPQTASVEMSLESGHI